MIRTSALVGLMLGLVVLFVGCGRGPKLVPVSGTVTMDGKPLADASLTFSFADYPRPAAGRTDSSGAFTLSYHNRVGAPIGKCKVMISKRGKSEDSDGIVELVPGRFNSNTQLEKEVTKEGPNEFSFDISSEPNEADGPTRQAAPKNKPPSDDEVPEEGQQQVRPQDPLQRAPAAEEEPLDDGE